MINTVVNTGIKIKRFFKPHGIILLYHRVNDLDIDPQLLAVKKENFKSHMKVLREYFNPVSVGEMLQALNEHRLKKNSVAVTFDDGYADNNEIARPVLEKFAIPATIFLAIGNILDARPFWWDVLEQIFFKDHSLPSTLDLELESGRYYRDCIENKIEDILKYSDWNMLVNNDPLVRHKIYRELAVLLRTLKPQHRDEILNRLIEWSGIQVNNMDQYRLLSTSEIGNLSQNKLIDIGAHTCQHALLSSLEKNEQAQEITDSKEKIEKLTGRTVNSFAYPYGYKGSFTKQSSTIVKNAGFRYSCANHHGVVFNDTDEYTLPRVIIRNMDGDGFRHYLNGVLG